MTVPLAAKIGAEGVFAAGVPVSYLVLDKFLSLNEIEKSVLEENITLTVSTEDTGATVTATTSVTIPAKEESSQVYKWECKITAEGLTSGDGTKLKTYLEKKLPTTTPTTEEPEKTQKAKNKEQLVWECSKDRKGVEGDTYKSELKITATKTGEEISHTSLFGPKESTSPSQ